MGSQSQTQLSDIHNSRLLERQATTNLDSILKSRDIIFVDKCPSSQSYGFSSGHVRMCELDIKKAECWRIDAFKLWCWRLFESPLDCKEILPVNLKGDQSWIFIGWTDGWSWNSNTLATWCEELTPWKRPWYWVRLKSGREGDDRGWDGLTASLTQWTWVWASSGSWWWRGKPGVLQSMGS